LLWIALTINFLMLGIELATGWNAPSVSLLVLSVAAAAWRYREGPVKGLSMGGYQPEPAAAVFVHALIVDQ
jgi:hypothetical protein